MTQTRTEESILNEIDSIQRKMMQVMVRLTSVGNPQVSSINLELTQLARNLARLQEDTRVRFATQRERMEALAGVGSVINSSLGLKKVLDEVMDSLIVLMKAERGFLMLKDEKGDFRVQIARDANNQDLTEDVFSISKSIVRQVLERGETVLTTNARTDPRFEQQASVAAYQLLSILCAPLKVKDELIGVIYVDNRAQTGIFSSDELELISMFANQAAVAIDNARLFDGLQASNEELQEAYHATLEGWVRALDLRDKETEGHTKRVTALTEKLARKMGVDENALVHIQRGALLHDIGKMAIPDGILLKPAALSPEERTLIEMHPVYAYEMLTPIRFLSPALDIPYCHHEKWDGTGYPRGLSGDTIPLAARIFAVVDVWDALVSDRPYRKAMKPEDVKRKLREDSGRHFDPQVVDAFLELDDQTLRSVVTIS
ncbi:MAG: GAF domain-containing protein [Anaerolineales bacterium]|jgi:putative nucleotidyltransferase with HDIG domain|uniref:HD-GYP domain-containing protein n=1 Tax=Candidatus Villigracilis vicinus TaxID=3140679 RepID=UPI0031353D40|nr:GAF domain-containing protein [Anaerolineales bacterium]